MDEWISVAADAIEQLVSKCNHLAEENAKLKAERDAAVHDMKRRPDCLTCKYWEDGGCKNHKCFMWNKWEWRGIKEEE